MDRKWIWIIVIGVVLYLAYKHGYLNQFLHSSGGGRG